MITVEDLIEEIVGDIRDEHDESTPTCCGSGRSGGCRGCLRTDEVADATGFRAPEGDYETIGGLVMHALGHIPAAGESVDLSAFDPDAVPGPAAVLAGHRGRDGRPAHRPGRPGQDRARRP